MTVDSARNLYGTTLAGGAHNAGAIYRIDPDGVEIVIYSFSGEPDGAGPAGPLLLDDSGNLYGTTAGGGAYNAGTVFELAPDGTETALYSFGCQSGCSDGSYPYSGLIMDSSGNLYGTTLYGGNDSCGFGCGTVFKLAPGGSETVLYSFQGGSDGYYPNGGVVADLHGNLYGTTFGGGASEAQCKGGIGYGGCGMVFKLAPDGTETNLHNFKGRSGVLPSAGLIADQHGNLYGTAIEGGETRNCCGVVFRLAK